MHGEMRATKCELDADWLREYGEALMGGGRVTLFFYLV